MLDVNTKIHQLEDQLSFFRDLLNAQVNEDLQAKTIEKIDDLRTQLTALRAN